MTAIETILDAIENDAVETAVNLDLNTITVPSSDGTRRYIVTFAGSPEFMNPNVNTWDCNCPAGRHGKMCKHIEQAARSAHRLNDMLGQE